MPPIPSSRPKWCALRRPAFVCAARSIRRRSVSATKSFCSSADEVAVPIASFEGGIGRPDVLRLSRRDPNVDLSDRRYVVYRGRTYLSTLSHLRLARSRDGVHFTVDDEPFLFPAD